MDRGAWTPPPSHVWLLAVAAWRCQVERGAPVPGFSLRRIIERGVLGALSEAAVQEALEAHQPGDAYEELAAAVEFLAVTAADEIAAKSKRDGARNLLVCAPAAARPFIPAAQERAVMNQPSALKARLAATIRENLNKTLAGAGAERGRKVDGNS